MGKLVTRDEAARACGVHSTTISHWRKTKKIRAEKVFNEKARKLLWYVDLDEAMAYVERPGGRELLARNHAYTKQRRDVVCCRDCCHYDGDRCAAIAHYTGTDSRVCADDAVEGCDWYAKPLTGLPVRIRSIETGTLEHSRIMGLRQAKREQYEAALQELEKEDDDGDDQS